ncbi:MAG: hypothetical protein ACRDI2_00720 [Chloroflexota bacterium]
MAATLPLLPRYQRPLTFGGVLDETFRIYRRWWPRLMAITALSIFPGAIALLVLGGAAVTAFFSDVMALTGDEGARNAVLAGLGAGVVVAAIVYGLCVLAGQAAVSAMTDGLIRGAERSVWQAFGMAFNRILALIGATFVYSLATLALAVAAVPLFVLGGFGIVGGLVALIAAVFWVNRPERRPPWLKWLIILAVPFGLPIYFGVRWSLWLQAIVLDRAGPIAGLQRSGALVQGHWFHVAGIWFVLGVVVYILQSIPGAIVLAVAAIAGVRGVGSDADGINLIVTLGNNAANFVGWILFGALTFIAATLLFVDLRNRREGADLAERLDVLEAGASAAS